MDPDAIGRMLGLLSDHDFYRHAHGRLFAAMAGLHRKDEPVDVVTLREELERRNELSDLGGMEYVSELCEVLPTAANAEYYARIVRDRSVRRQMIRIGTSLVQQAHELDTEPEVTLADITDGLLGLHLNEDEAEVVTTKDLMWDLGADLDRGVPTLTGNRINTGFNTLDYMFGGFVDSELDYWSGGPGSGKTTAALQVAKHIARNYRHVFFVSMELGKKRIAKRLAAIESLVEGRVIDYGPQHVFEAALPDIYHGLSKASDLPLFFMFGRKSTQQVLSRAKQIMHRAKGKIVVFIDRIELFSDRDTEGLKEYERVTMLSPRVKGIATALDCPVICLVQQSRGGQESDVPTMSGFRGSGHLEQDCQRGVVIRSDKDAGQSVFWVVKANDGAVGACDPLLWRPKIPAFYDMARSN